MSDKQELIKIVQLPIIEQRLNELSIEIARKLKDATNLVCNEDSVKEIKKTRAELNKEFNELEEQRKKVKSAIMEKYNSFEKIYKEKVADLYKDADSDLKSKIDNIELNLKKEKRDELFDFAMEYIKANDIEEFITFDEMGLNITLSASMKSLKEQIVDICEKVKQDIQLTRMEEYRDEILYEYKKCRGNFAQCKMNVIERHRQLDEMKNIVEKQEIKEEQQEKVAEQVEEIISMPVEIDEEEISVSFTVTGPKSKIIELREFMKKEGIKYE